MVVLVFKTNVKTKREIAELRPNLNFLLHDCRWNFDLTDCDNVLRIETPDLEISELALSINPLTEMKKPFKLIYRPNLFHLFPAVTINGHSVYFARRIFAESNL